MSLLEKARAIHTWIDRNITYASNRERGTLKAAYNGFRTRQGDCYTFCSVSEVLLTRAGIPNMRITRIPGNRTHHVWNLINVGTGWYHFDTIPLRSTIDRFMFTSVQAATYTRWITHIDNFYVYDRSLYPPIAGDEELYGDEDLTAAEFPPDGEQTEDAGEER